MVVYLDLLILDNFCADAALLYCAVRTVKGEVRWRRILLAAALGAALGTGYAVFTLFFSLPAPLDFFVRWGVLFVLPLPAASFRYKRTYALCSLAFVGYMAALAGILTAKGEYAFDVRSTLKDMGLELVQNPHVSDNTLYIIGEPSQTLFLNFWQNIAVRRSEEAALMKNAVAFLASTVCGFAWHPDYVAKVVTGS